MWFIIKCQYHNLATHCVYQVEKVVLYAIWVWDPSSSDYWFLNYGGKCAVACVGILEYHFIHIIWIFDGIIARDWKYLFGNCNLPWQMGRSTRRTRLCYWRSSWIPPFQPSVSTGENDASCMVQSLRLWFTLISSQVDRLFSSMLLAYS